MSNESELAVIVREELQLGSLVVTDYKEVIIRATEVAKSLAKIINDQKLFTNIQGKKYVQVTGWSTLGAMLGVLPREVEHLTVESENGDITATVELVRASDQAVIGRGSAIVGADEKKWSSSPRYARRSMAVTRACGKAFRLAFAWIMTLAGYEATPAEEMDFIDGESHAMPVNPEPKPLPVKTNVKPMDASTAFWSYCKANGIDQAGGQEIIKKAGSIVDALQLAKDTISGNQSA